MSEAAGTAVVVVFTVLAAVVVVLTRVRLGRGGAGRVDVGGTLVGLHTVAGVAALVVWTTFLIAPDDTVAGGALVGIIGLAFWWIVALVGLLVLARWLPSRGRHSRDGAVDGWSRGPWLSVLAHVGLLVDVSVLTWGYLTRTV